MRCPCEKKLEIGPAPFYCLYCGQRVGKLGVQDGQLVFMLSAPADLKQGKVLSKAKYFAVLENGRQVILEGAEEAAIEAWKVLLKTKEGRSVEVKLSDIVAAIQEGEERIACVA